MRTMCICLNLKNDYVRINSGLKWINIIHEINNQKIEIKVQ